MLEANNLSEAIEATRDGAERLAEFVLGGVLLPRDCGVASEAEV